MPAIPFVQNGGVQAWEFRTAKRITPTGAFRTGDLEQLRVGVLEQPNFSHSDALLDEIEQRVQNGYRDFTVAMTKSRNARVFGGR